MFYQSSCITLLLTKREEEKKEREKEKSVGLIFCEVQVLVAILQI
jgi:hypothetical protein